MKKSIFLLPLFLLIFSHISIAQTAQSGDLVMIRMVENRFGYGQVNALLHITEADGSYRKIELEAFKGPYLKTDTENQKTLHTELKSYLKQGYKIISHEKGSESAFYWFEDYLLYKE